MFINFWSHRPIHKLWNLSKHHILNQAILLQSKRPSSNNINSRSIRNQTVDLTNFQKIMIYPALILSRMFIELTTIFHKVLHWTNQNCFHYLTVCLLHILIIWFHHNQVFSISNWWILFVLNSLLHRNYFLKNVKFTLQSLRFFRKITWQNMNFHRRYSWTSAFISFA